MQESTSTSSLQDLLHNAQKAEELCEILKFRARSLKLEDVKEILEKVQAAESEGQALLADVASLSESEQEQARQAVEQIANTRAEAQKYFDRKFEWETRVEANAKIINVHASRAAEIHKRLRERRRELCAADVEGMRLELISLESEAMAAWGVVRGFSLPVSFEHRLYRATETIANALKDAVGTLARKKPWEDAVATNIAAVEAELGRLEAAVARLHSALTGPVSEGPRAAASVPAPSFSETSAPQTGEAPIPENAAREKPLPPEAPDVKTQGAGPVADPQTRPATDSANRRAFGKETAHSEDVPSESDLIRQVKKIEDMLRNRRPIDRDAREALTSRLSALAERGDVGSHLKAGANRPPQRFTREQMEGSKLEVENLLEQVESALDISWPHLGQREGSAPDDRPERSRSKEKDAGAAGPHPDGPEGSEGADALQSLETETDTARTPIDEASPQAEAAGRSTDAASPATNTDASGEPPLEAEEPQGGTPDESSQPSDTDARGPASAADHEPTERADHEHAEGDESEQPTEPPEVMKLGAIKTVQSHLRRARELLESGIVPGPSRKTLWARFRHASDHLRSRRHETRAREFDILKDGVREAHRLAAQASPSRARRWIQDLQKAILASTLNRGERDEFLKSLREAWAIASKHQDELQETQKRREQDGFNRLGEHLCRWKGRRQGILKLLSRLETQLQEYRDRQKTSTSIGYRVVAEQRMAELRERIQELGEIVASLDTKIADVEPRLEAAGWEPPDPDSSEQMNDGPGKQALEDSSLSSEGSSGQGRGRHSRRRGREEGSGGSGTRDDAGPTGKSDPATPE